MARYLEAVATVEPVSNSEQAAYGKWLDQTSDREEGRRDRLHGAEGIIPTSIWFVLFLIAAVVFAVSGGHVWFLPLFFVLPLGVTNLWGYLQTRRSLTASSASSRRRGSRRRPMSRPPRRPGPAARGPRRRNGPRRGRDGRRVGRQSPICSITT